MAAHILRNNAGWWVDSWLGVVIWKKKHHIQHLPRSMYMFSLVSFSLEPTIFTDIPCFAGTA